MTRDEFVRALLAGSEINLEVSYSDRLKEIMAPFLPQIDNTVYTCSSCSKGYRGPICGHCGLQHIGE